MNIRSHQIAKHIFRLIVAAAFIIVLVVGIYFYIQYKNTQSLLKNPAVVTQVETQNLVATIGKLMVLPTGETPTLATVADVTKLQSTPFFKNAKNGDKLLIYSTAKEAILYDPGINKIIGVGPVNIGNQSPLPSTPAITTTKPTSVRVAIYNGTSTSGLTNKTERDLVAQFSKVTVISKKRASAQYPSTLVVDLSGTQTDLASQMANTLGGTVGVLPSGELAPTNADILIILGK